MGDRFHCSRKFMPSGILTITLRVSASEYVRALTNKWPFFQTDALNGLDIYLDVPLEACFCTIFYVLDLSA